MTNGLDCATKLTAVSANALKAAGYDFVARYLGNSWKTFDATEAAIIKAAGLNLISIFQKSANFVGYFSKAQGISDANEAYQYAKAVGQPVNSAIYFVVDLDAHPANMPAILAYVDGLKETLKDYKIGIYGSYAVMQAVKGKVDYYWQTYAWSNGQEADFIHMYQYQNGVTVAGVQIDRNNIKKTPGAWQSDVKVDVIQPSAKSPNMYRLIKGNDVYDTSVPVYVYAKLKDGYRVESVPNDKAMSSGMIRLVNAKGDVIDSGDVSIVNSLIATGYLAVFIS